MGLRGGVGGFRLVGGQLVPASIDAYLVMEWADGGDLFGLRGQLAAGEVRMLMRQLLEALAYLHSQVRLARNTGHLGHPRTPP